LEVLDRETDNGSGASILPKRRKRERRGASNRTDPANGSGSVRRYRPGAAIPPRRFSKEGGRCGGVKGRIETQVPRRERAGNLPSVNPRRSKAGTGSRGESNGSPSRAKFRPRMPVGERTARRVTWNAARRPEKPFESTTGIIPGDRGKDSGSWCRYPLTAAMRNRGNITSSSGRCHDRLVT